MPNRDSLSARAGPASKAREPKNGAGLTPGPAFLYDARGSNDRRGEATPLINAYRGCTTAVFDLALLRLAFCGGVLYFRGSNDMPAAKKEATIEELRKLIANSPNLFFTDFVGLTVEEITKLRGELRKDGTTYAVVKNTLFKRAAGEELAAKVDQFLAGPTAIVFGGADPVAPA